MEKQKISEQIFIDHIERYERKWVINQISSASSSALIRNLPLVLTETYPQRSVHSLYFDTENFSSFQLHEAGGRNRYKIRIRWYHELASTLVNAQLEIKIRNERMVKKHTYKLGFINLSDLFNKNFHKFLCDILPNQIAELCKNLRPKLITSYDRRYYAAYGGKVRVTFDNNLIFYKYAKNISISENGSIKMPTSIIELKYPLALNSELTNYLATFPGTQTRNSKYTSAVKCLLGV